MFTVFRDIFCWQTTYWYFLFHIFISLHYALNNYILTFFPLRVIVNNSSAYLLFMRGTRKHRFTLQKTLARFNYQKPICTSCDSSKRVIVHLVAIFSLSICRNAASISPALQRRYGQVWNTICTENLEILKKFCSN